MEDTNYIGSVCLIDDKLVWCTYTQEIISLALGDFLLLILVDNDVMVYNKNHCELEGRCFNFDCKYNQDKNISHYRETMSDHEFTTESINNVRKNFKGITESILEEPKVVKALNNNWLVSGLFDWERFERESLWER